jgi:protein-disulfide isomerase
MAGNKNMKLFYGGLGLIAVAGTAVIWMATRGGGAPPVQLLDEPFALGTSAFPGYVIGSDSAPVEIVQYADFACQHCATFTILHGPTIMSRLVETGLARLRFRGFALYQVSLLPLNAAACAGEQGKFWPMHESLMFNQSDWFNDPEWATSRRTLRTFRQYARDAGMDVDRYDQCMEEGRYNDRIVATREEIAALGIHSTPAFDVGTYRAVGMISYDSLRTLVEMAAGIRQ